MARVAGVNLPNKRIVVALTYLYGIGSSRARTIVKEAGIDPNKRANDLTDQEVNKARQFIEKAYVIEGDLKAQVRGAIKRLIDINAYRGSRHKKGLPLRGQRTRTNARTRKGRGKTIANKKGVKK